MNIDSILVPERTRCNLQATSKKRAIEEAAGYLADALPEVSAAEIYEGLINREKLGTTAIGHGIAIPHCRMQNCSSTIGGLFRLSQAVDFAAFDDQPVEIMFVLIVPSEEADEHLQTLAMLAERFESSDYRKKLLTAKSDRELYDLAVQDPMPDVKQA